ncbi:hypothetical protein CHA01nite_07310 [Chryseobacterium hagamense]|uniref:Uncharacterized protein n=2 Tax=Chryseobacterium hagamense TaxID=395935 RepID=A0A511YIG6_9FLAO|nr:hypothetical protein CHA01nite_07310 [Chryseobacterium hagamense]
MVFRPLIPLVEYAVNYDYIVETLCINKSRPELHCNGTCYLTREIAKNNAPESFPLSKSKNSGKTLLDIYILPEIADVTPKFEAFSSGTGFSYKTDYFFLFLKSIFRPPVF